MGRDETEKKIENTHYLERHQDFYPNSSTISGCCDRQCEKCTICETGEHALFFRGLLLVWCSGEGYVVYDLFSQETLLFLPGQIAIGESLFGIMFRKTRYAMQHNRHLRVNTENSPERGHLIFEYEGQIIRYGQQIETQEAEYLLDIWMNLMTSHYHSVQRILFGEFPLITYNPVTTARNIDFSTVTFPYVHVTQILIDTMTYDFHQLEHFLTYSLNYMKHAYLKHHVNVHIYGHPEKLHPNLLNNVKNLCKHVHIHTQSEPSQIHETGV